VGTVTVNTCTTTPCSITLASGSGSASQSVCKNSPIPPIVFNIIGGGAAVTATLPAGVMGSYNAATQQFTISGTPTVEGTFDYTLTTTGSCATPSSLSGTLTLGLGLAGSSGALSQSVCKNSSITPIVFNIIGGGVEVTATLPAGVTGVYNNVSQQFTISGTPTVEGTFNFTVSTNGGTCTTPSSLSGTITVNPSPVVTVNSATICTGQSATLTASGATSYVWSDGWANSNQITVAPSQITHYTVTGTSANGCNSSVVGTVTVDSCTTSTNPLTISVSSIDASNSTICNGTAVATVAGGTPPYNITFGGNTAVGATYAINNLCAGFYTVKTKDANSDSASFTFVIGSPATTFPYVTPIFPDSAIVDTLVTNALPNCVINYSIIDSITITNFSFVGLDSVNVTWTIFQAGGLTNTQNANYQFSLPGLYTFVLDLFCTNRVSGSAKGIDQLYISKSMTGIAQHETSNTITIYPNPTSGIINIGCPNPTGGNMLINIYDMLGNNVYVSTLQGGGGAVALPSGLGQGIYFISIQTNEGIVNKKIVISK
jgi:hypothetical protein